MEYATWPSYLDPVRIARIRSPSEPTYLLATTAWSNNLEMNASDDIHLKHPGSRQVKADSVAFAYFSASRSLELVIDEASNSAFSHAIHTCERKNRFGNESVAQATTCALQLYKDGLDGFSPWLRPAGAKTHADALPQLTTHEVPHASFPRKLSSAKGGQDCD